MNLVRKSKYAEFLKECPIHPVPYEKSGKDIHRVSIIEAKDRKAWWLGEGNKSINLYDYLDFILSFRSQGQTFYFFEKGDEKMHRTNKL